MFVLLNIFCDYVELKVRFLFVLAFVFGLHFYGSLIKLFVYSQLCLDYATNFLFNFVMLFTLFSPENKSNSLNLSHLI